MLGRASEQEVPNRTCSFMLLRCLSRSHSAVVGDQIRWCCAANSETKRHTVYSENQQIWLFWKRICGLKRNGRNSRPEISTFRVTLLFRDGWFLFIKSYISRRFVLWAVKSLQFRSSSTEAAAGVWPDCMVERCLHLTTAASFSAVCLLTHCVTNIIIPPKYDWTHFPCSS